jgi:ABC-2 type transport system ATP-binding protein
MPSDDYAIETAGLTKVFFTRWKRREVRAVDQISLQIPRGTTYGFLGPNGAGKTTFVKMLLSAVHPTAGSASIFGKPAEEAEARRPIGYLPENHRFPTYFTGAGMLDFYASLSDLAPVQRKLLIPELLERVGLEKWGAVRIGKYSKGMLQRLGLAQALIHSPKLLILDEPSDGVDPVGRKHIREILGALEEKGVTIFINSHLLVEVEMFCKEVAILDQGKVALAGRVRDLTGGKGFRLAARQVPELLHSELERHAVAAKVEEGLSTFQFSTLEDINTAIDLLRAEKCTIEIVTPTTSTLEEVFFKTVEK